MVLILAGCGGGGQGKTPQPEQTVSGRGFTFAAPTGWRVRHVDERTEARRDSELVQVATFPLAKDYTPRLFERVAAELQARMRTVAAETGGRLAGSSVVTASGIRAHSYRVSVGDHVDEYTFVLRGRREYQLLCRRLRHHDAAFCNRLVTSFRVA